MRKKLTNRQAAILDYLISYIRQRGFPPSIREIGAHFGIRSLRGVTVHLEALTKKGYIERGQTPRSIKVLELLNGTPISAEIKAPLLGTIRAGAPLLAEEHVEGYLSVPPEIMGRARSVFALRVSGDSMTGDHILQGDIVFVSEQNIARNGEIVAAIIGDEATIKRLKMENGRLLLLPANAPYEPIDANREDCRILGKVIGLIRGY